MEIVNIESLITKKRIAKLADLDQDTTFLQVGVFQKGNRKRGGEPNSYKPYVISFAELLSGSSGGGLTNANNGLSVVSGVAKLGGTLAQNTTIDLNGKDFVFSNVTAGAGSDDVLVLDGSGKLKKVAGSTFAGITNSAGVDVVTKSDGTNLVASNINDDGTYISLNSDVKVLGSLVDGTNALSIDVNNRTGKDSTGADSIYWDTRILLNSAGSGVMNWDTGILFDASGNSSVDFFTRKSYDASANDVLDWTGTNAAVQVKGTTSDATAHAFRVYNSTPTDIFSILNDGTIKIHGGNGFNGTFELHQKTGTTNIMTVYNQGYSKLMLSIIDNGAAGNVSICNGGLTVDAYNGNVALGGLSPNTARIRIPQDTTNDIIAITPSSGNGGIYANSTAGATYFYFQDSSSSTTVVLIATGDSYFNGGNLAIGRTSATARLHTKGNSTATDYCFKADDNSNNPLLYVRNDGRINMAALPTSAAGLAAGDLWNNLGIINIA